MKIMNLCNVLNRPIIPMVEQEMAHGPHTNEVECC